MPAAKLPVPAGKSMGDKVLLWFVLLLFIISLIFCGFLLLRMAGPKTLRSLGMVTRIMVQTGLLPKSVLTSAAPVTGAVGQGARLGRAPRGGQQQARTGDPTQSAPVCSPDDPVAAAQPGELSLLDPLAAYDLAAGRSAEARGLAMATPISVPAVGGNGFLSASADAGLGPAVAPVPAAGAAAPVAPAAPAAAAAPLEIPTRALAGPAAAPALVYSVELGFFLSGDTASAFAGELMKRGIQVALVTEPDATGRVWTYVRSGRFNDGAQALAYAQDLELRQRLPGILVTEKQEAPK
ncbi:hypothetical protein ACFSM5_15200 [Lacibacterium aquatile]|uniref:SPOR domain-containing protein n=1 Tax=Lacibacterium aquatile TaxID=1168082 RepID=A0ABW5DSW9_9PROT